MSRVKAWLFGFLMIVIFVMVGEFVIIFKDYIFVRLGADRNFVLTILWLLPVFASFVAVFFPKRNGLIAGLSYIPILSVFGPIVHYICGQFGAKIDFGGLSGLRITFQIYLVLSVITIGIGCIAGISLKGRKRPGS